MTYEYSFVASSAPSVQLGVVIKPECATQHPASSVRVRSTVYARAPVAASHETATDVALVATAFAFSGAGPGVVVGSDTVAIGVRICAFNADAAAITTIEEP